MVLSQCYGLIIGAATFLIIGLFHPLVIKGEYYFGVKIWWMFVFPEQIARVHHHPA